MRTVLVVEDEILIRIYVADFLRDSGFEVIEADDAVSAIATLQSARRVDLVFTDITLPGDLDGFGLAQWVRQRKPDIPVILTSGKLTREAALETAAEPFFAKPCDYAEVAAHMRGLLAKCSSA